MGSADRPTVLVVEDEPPLVEVYTRWLDADYNVRMADSGSKALDRVDETVDVVLLDRLMPGMDGATVLEKITDKVPDCRVAMVTAVEPDFDVVDMGFDAYLTKPIKPDELVSTVDRLLARDSFAELEREFFSLAARRAVLQETKSTAELESSTKYTDLEERIETVRDKLDRVLPGLEDEEFVALVRDLENHDVGDGEEGWLGQPHGENATWAEQWPEGGERGESDLDTEEDRDGL